MAGSSREVFDDTILEFTGKMSEANKDDIDVLFKALTLAEISLFSKYV